MKSSTEIGVVKQIFLRVWKDNWLCPSDFIFENSCRLGWRLECCILAKSHTNYFWLLLYICACACTHTHKCAIIKYYGFHHLCNSSNKSRLSLSRSIYFPYFGQFQALCSYFLAKDEGCPQINIRMACQPNPRQPTELLSLIVERSSSSCSEWHLTIKQ